MNSSLRKDRIFSIHQFVKKNTQRIYIKFGIFTVRLLLELFMVKIRNISFLLQNLCGCLVDRHDFTYLRDSVLDIDVFYMQ